MIKVLDWTIRFILVAGIGWVTLVLMVAWWQA